MLHFITGRARSGKSYELLNGIENCVKCGEYPILLVPEQFSFEAERSVLDRLGDTLAQKVSVMSFSRLCDEVSRKIGGVCAKTVSESDKLILISRAVKSVKDELTLFKKYANSIGFAEKMSETVTEFQLNAVSYADLKKASELAGEGTLSKKLFDTAVIYEAYTVLLGENFVDTSTQLEKLYYNLNECDIFKDRHVFVDGFKGFTGAQFKIFERIFTAASDVTVALTGTGDSSLTYGIFANVNATKEKLKSIAKRHGVKIDSDTVFSDCRYEKEGLKSLESVISSNYKDVKKQTDGVCICKADNIYDEAEFVARNIRRLVRTENLRYSDFVVIARDASTYKNALFTAFEKYSLSAFYDGRMPLSSLHPACCVLAAVDFARGITTEKILRFLKTGAGILNYDDISELETYAYIWKIDGKAWNTDWDMNPSGFTENMREVDKKNLERLNQLRERIIKPINSFKKNFCGDSKTMACAVVKLLEDFNAPKAFSAMADEYENMGDSVYSDALRQAWDKVMEILDSTVDCYGNCTPDTNEFCKILENAISTTDVGVIPQMADQVSFGSADRIRPYRPKYVFLLGANSGVFPRTVSGTGLFSLGERAKFKELEIDIPDKMLYGTIDEDYLVYSNVCCSSKGVFISYSTALPNGGKGIPSAFVTDILECLDCKTVTEPCIGICEDNMPETESSAFSQFCRLAYTDRNSASTILSAFENGQLIGRAKSLLKENSFENASISPETASELYGSKIKMSPTRLEEFSRCKFRHFCNYGLRVRSLKPAEINELNRGSIVHYVLQRAIETYKDTLGDLTAEQLQNASKNFIDEYLDMISGFRSSTNARTDYIIKSIIRSVTSVLLLIGAELSQSDFKPVKCELVIDDGGDIPSVKVPIEGKGEISLNGKVDRLDKWNGYVRIIDYKTGEKTFNLPDLLFGQNMQMMLYLYAVSKSENYGGIPAGILYYAAKRDKDNKKHPSNGIIASEESVVYAMEKENDGRYIPSYNAEKPSDSFISVDNFYKVFDFIDRKLYETGADILSGNIAVDPVDSISASACNYCDFKDICRIGDKEHTAVPKIDNNAVMEEIERQVQRDGI